MQFAPAGWLAASLARLALESGGSIPRVATFLVHRVPRREETQASNKKEGRYGVVTAQMQCANARRVS